MLIQEWNNATDVSLPTSNFTKVKEEDLIRAYAYIGESIVNKARELGDYTDRTGNLRSSIWYGVYKDGELVKVDMSNALPDAKTQIETQQWRIKEYAIENDSIVLVVGAGMEYAAFVEGYDFDVLSKSVLSKSQFLAMLKSLVE